MVYLVGGLFAYLICLLVSKLVSEQDTAASVLKVSYFRLSLIQSRTGAALITCSCSVPVFNPAVTFYVHNKVSKIDFQLTVHDLEAGQKLHPVEIQNHLMSLEIEVIL